MDSFPFLLLTNTTTQKNRTQDEMELKEPKKSYHQPVWLDWETSQ